ncbi:DUF3306 domain-containing protein [Alkalilimnicola ehrlichii MLHE-1]|uniref:DUF3306 domain-containing protein n=1 Tax=Alkalilimnicola ehrlichii (strain ATCC BAA-1101 / DSM 17681 / MLHE-1) TaxID=187272 RepID=Q0A956_ALKEH|nr:DUF3306 domain-containing protein [Alkalilimnicola ehrlichii]ABI56631.1 hypothetical protein Mlg_1282 [Alkalilimnicola ehrlichii MLHE-1]
MSEERYRNDLTDDPSGLLRRWSRRKHQVQRGEEGTAPGRAPEAREGMEAAAPDPVPVGDRIDPRTGKRIDELTDDDMPPLETLGASSDLSCFWSRGVSEALRHAALRQVFRSPKYNVVDTLCEYSGDYTRYEPLGEVVTHDMKRQIARLAERERERERARAEEAEAPAGAEEAVADSEERAPGPAAEAGETPVAEHVDGAEAAQRQADRVPSPPARDHDHG